MVVSFDIVESTENSYRIILSSGEDAFFAQPDLLQELGPEVELVEIDLERTCGTQPTSVLTLQKIAEGIAQLFLQNEKAILYYYCDDMLEVPTKSDKHRDMWPQEYRSELFGRLFRRHVSRFDMQNDVRDVEVVIYQGNRPLFIHIIARSCHLAYLEHVKRFLIDNYGK